MEIKKSALFRVIKGQTAYLQNVGFDYNEMLNKLKALKGIEPTDNGFELSNDELAVILNNVVDNGEVIGVYNYPNNFNRDQKELNIIKRNYEAELKSKGYTIIDHCEWQPHFNEELLNKIINERNYLTNIIEQIKQRRRLFSKFETEIEALNKQKIENAEKIKKQNWYLEEVQQKLKDAQEELEKTIERYKKGKICIEEQRNNLPQDVKDLNDKIYKLKYDYDQLDVQYKQKYDSYTDQLKTKENEINELNLEKTSLKDEISTLIKTKENLEKQNRELDAQINKYKNLENDVENKRKFITVCKMYKLQNWELPDFEIEVAKNTGLNDEEISNIINTFYK